MTHDADTVRLNISPRSQHRVRIGRRIRQRRLRRLAREMEQAATVSGQSLQSNVAGGESAAPKIRRQSGQVLNGQGRGRHSRQRGQQPLSRISVRPKERFLRIRRQIHGKGLLRRRQLGRLDRGEGILP